MSSTPTIRPAQPEHAAAWVGMRRRLWPDATEAEHRGEVQRYFAGHFPRGPWHALLAFDAAGRAIGFAEVSVRAYAEGCDSVGVGYLEGWFVDDPARRRGVGRALVAAAEDWARARGLTEFASDADPDNAASVSAHRALGFEDQGLVRCFRKRL